MQTVIALYQSRTTAENAVNTLVAAGIPRANIRVESGENYTDTKTYVETDRDVNRGGLAGFFDWLFGTGVPEDDAHIYTESIRRGDYAVIVQSDDASVSNVESILNDFDPIDVDHRADYFRSTGWTAYDASAPVYDETQITTDRTTYNSSWDDTQTNIRKVDVGTSDKLEVVEEELQVGKRDVERGKVRAHTYVTERPVEAQVNLREEHVHVERRAVDRPAGEADFINDQAVIEVTEMGEEPIVSKKARVVEEVVLGKDVTEHTETIRDTVRRKDVDVENIDTTDTTRNRNR